MDIKKKALQKHYEWRGKIEINSRVKIVSNEDLSLAYTPGVAAPCLEIQKDREKSFALTGRGNTIAIITDGSAVLGLGNIGPEAAMPVMEGKSVLFKDLAGVDCFPLCIDSMDTDEIVKTVSLLSKSFGGINLEDISAPRCFEIERRLDEALDIPVFHDDQHGTAIVVAAALINSVKLAGKGIDKVRVVINGAGSAGIAIAYHLLTLGVSDIILVDKRGALVEGDPALNAAQSEISRLTNKHRVTGSLDMAIPGADIFIGVSAPGVLTPDMVQSMGGRPIIFAMANPTPEIMPEEAIRAGAFIVGTGRSDYPNQINNLLAFPGIFRGALDMRAKRITDKMKLQASVAIASMVDDSELSTVNILPSPLDREVPKVVAKAIADCGR